MKGRRSILIVDDDRLLCNLIRNNICHTNMNFMIANTCKEALEICSSRRIDVVLLDQRLPDGEGHLIMSSILSYREQTKIIFISAYPTFESAVKALKAGAYDYLSKPFEMGALELAIEKAVRSQELEQIEQIQSYKQKKESECSTLVGTHSSMQRVKMLIQLASKSNAPVLITGETGTGKTVAAKSIHYLMSDSASPFISINCSSVPDTLFEAELFGYEKGAFTDAKSSRKGIFIMADGGTLLLDEIGNMPLQLQSKLLSVLDEKKIKKLGGETFLPINVRIIAATNTDLETAIHQNRFRQDLYYRLNVIHIHMPSLREHLSDIPELCQNLLPQLSSGTPIIVPDSEMEKLQHYHWPGNIRELRNVLERAIILQTSGKIKPSLLIEQQKKRTDYHSNNDSDKVNGTLIEAEKNHIHRILNEYKGNLSRTAKALDISLSTLKRKIKKHGIEAKLEG